MCQQEKPESHLWFNKRPEMKTMSRVFTVLLLMSLVQWTSPDGWQFISGHTGGNVTLTFQVPTGTTAVWLKRIDDKYIAYCQDGRPTRPSDQEESFKGRVEGMDCGNLNGTVSVTVRNLTSNDSGTYEFHRVERDGRRFNKTIFLIVTDPVNPFFCFLYVGTVFCSVFLVYKIIRQCMTTKSCLSVSDLPCVKRPHHDDDDDDDDDDGDNENAPVFVPENKTIQEDTVVFMERALKKHF